MSARRTALVIAIASAALLAATEIGAYAATGQPLLLGKSNRADAPTTLSSSSGPALRLRSGPDAPPLAVESRRRVTGLNADRVDGLEAESLRTRVYRFTEDRVNQPLNVWSQWSLNGIPDGTYLVSWDVNVLPFEPQYTVECGLTRNDYDRQWGGDTAIGTAAKIAVWLSGAAVVDLDADAMHFYCQTDAPELALKQPLSVAFQRVDRVSERDLTPLVPTS
jgi:hypothetical protein